MRRLRHEAAALYLFLITVADCQGLSYYAEASLCERLVIQDPQQFSEQHRQWIQETLNNGINQRESCWTESIAVGGPGFVEEIKTGLGMKGIGRRIEDLEAGRCVLREEFEPYSADFALENGVLSPINSCLWDVF